MDFLIPKNNNQFLVDLIEKYQYSLNQVIFYFKIGNNWKFDKFLDTNESSNALKNKGLVTSMLKGIQKK